MIHTSLANSYRPTCLKELIGQDAIVSVFTEQLANNSVSQCNLFVGTAGTGKTTVARIIAKELNAEYHELDAASNNGIDNIRLLQEQASKKSLTNPCKCFVLDEAHAITSAGWQALLKIVEEPPANVFFIFCTTEPHKIPATIQSRVQRYNFNQVEDEAIKKRIIHIVQDIGNCSINSPAIDKIVSMANGSVRQAISYLEACLNHSSDVTLPTVLKALGEDSVEFVGGFYAALINNDAAASIKFIDDASNLQILFSQTIKIACDDCEYLIYCKKDISDNLNVLEWLVSMRENLRQDYATKSYCKAKILLRYAK